MTTANYNPYKEELPKIERHSYLGFVISSGALGVADVVLGISTIGAAFAFFLAGAIYIFPLVILGIVTAKFITRAIMKVIFTFTPKTKELRWTINSVANVFWSLPQIIGVGAAVIFFGTFILMIPYSSYQIIVNDKTLDQCNLFMMVYSSWFADNSTMSSMIRSLLFWDNASPIASTIKFIMMGVAGMLYYRGHPEVSKEQYLDSDDDCELMYE